MDGCLCSVFRIVLVSIDRLRGMVSVTCCALTALSDFYLDELPCLGFRRFFRLDKTCSDSPRTLPCSFNAGGLYGSAGCNAHLCSGCGSCGCHPACGCCRYVSVIIRGITKGNTRLIHRRTTQGRSVADTTPLFSPLIDPISINAIFS